MKNSAHDYTTSGAHDKEAATSNSATTPHKAKRTVAVFYQISGQVDIVVPADASHARIKLAFEDVDMNALVDGLGSGADDAYMTDYLEKEA